MRPLKIKLITHEIAMVVKSPTGNDNNLNHGVFHLTFKKQIINR